MLARLQPLFLATLFACSPDPVATPALDHVVQWSDGEISSAQDIAFGPNGELYTASFGRPDGRFRGALRLHAPSGETLWTALHDPELDAMARQVHALADGSVLMSAQSKLNPDSNQQFVWVGRFQPFGAPAQPELRLDYWNGPGEYSVPGDFDAADDGSMAIVGHGLREDEAAWLHRRGGSNPPLDLQLSKGFEEHRGGFVRLMGANTAVGFFTGSDALGNRNTGDLDAWVAVVDAAGDFVWTDQIGGAGRQTVNGADVDEAGNLYVCGTSEDLVDGRGDADAYVVAYDPEGSVLWTQSLGTPHADACLDLAASADGTLYLAGFEDRRDDRSGVGTVTALDASSGALLWHTPLALKTAGATFAQAVALHGGSIYVVGDTRGSFDHTPAPGTRQAFLGRLDEHGVLQN